MAAGNPAPVRRVLARAPGRIDLGGGGTDPEPYCSDFGGAVLNLAITYRTSVSIEPLEEPEVRLHSLDFDESATASLGTRFPLGDRLDLLKAAVHRFHDSLEKRDTGFTVTAQTELPPGSGLGSSASLPISVHGLFYRTEISLRMGRINADISVDCNSTHRRHRKGCDTAHQILTIS